jgi:hypothetical protein
VKAPTLTPADLVRQAQALLDELETLVRRMDPADPLSQEDPYNDFRREKVEDLIGRAQDRLERRQRAAGQ